LICSNSMTMGMRPVPAAPRTHSVDAPRETGETVSLGPGKGDIVLVCDSE